MGVKSEWPDGKGDPAGRVKWSLDQWKQAIKIGFGVSLILAFIVLLAGRIERGVFRLSDNREDYAEAKATVVSSELYKSGRNPTARRSWVRSGYRIDMTYRYEVDGVTYEGRSDYGPPSLFRDHEAAEQVQREMAVDGVTCWYVKTAPWVSRQNLNRAMKDATEQWVFTAMVMLMGFVGTWALIEGAWKWRRISLQGV